jgi:hypothetical protein
VSVRADATDAGARLRLDHGPYDGGQVDREDAESHRQGWEFFLPRLGRVLAEERFRSAGGGASSYLSDANHLDEE